MKLEEGCKGRDELGWKSLRDRGDDAERQASEKGTLQGTRYNGEINDA